MLLTLLISILTATISSYNAAQLTGDATTDMSVSFTNTSTSKGAVRKGDTATLVISNLPACSITRIEAYLKSNTASGAATVLLNLPKPNTTVLSGNYNTWPGANQSYSTTYLPIPLLTSAQSIAYHSSVRLTIIGTTNSVNLEKLVISYTLTPPVPHSVQLNYLTPSGQRWLTSTQTSADSAIILPQLPPTTYPGWNHIGWGYTPLATVEDSALTPGLLLYDYAPLTPFYPQSDTALYAVFAKDNPSYTLTQTTSFTSGEYALLLAGSDEWRILSSSVTSNTIRTEASPLLSDTNGLYTFSAQSLDPTYRYTLTFTHDSLTIYHPSTSTWVGYSSHKLSSTPSSWLWAEHSHHTIDFYTPDTAASGTYLLWLDYTPESPVAAITLGNRATIQEAWILFEVSDIPTTPELQIFTSYPYPITSIPEVSTQQKYSPCEKYFYHGHLVIQRDNHLYDITGQLFK